MREELDRVTASDVFTRSERMKRFLRFTVEQTLRGAAEQIKEYSIAVAVFDKPESFDPRLDPIVRVEAGRLRSKLREYYETAGQSDPLVISFRKRGYVPSFKFRKSPHAAATVPAQARNTAPFHLPIADVLIEEPLPELTTGELNSVAVLPFADMSPKKDQEYFCDGMTDEIVNSLSRVEGLRVASRTSVMQYKDEASDIRRIGMELGVAAVLEGSVRKSAKRVRITAQLINAADGYNLWSDVYERQMSDIFDIQLDIAGAIVKALRIRLLEESGSIAVRFGTRDPEAYQFYLQGRHHWNRRSQHSVRRAITYFEKAIANDPAYALAHIGLADAYASLAWLGAASPEVAWPKAAESARHGVEADPTIGQAHVSMGCVKAVYEWDWAGSEEEFKRAIELAPVYETAHDWYGFFCLAAQGRLEEAERELNLARDIAPTSPVISAHLGWIRFLQGDYKAAATDFRKSLELQPDFYLAHLHIGSVFEQRDNLKEALSAYKAAHSVAPRQPFILSALGRCHALMGNERKATACLQQLERLAKKRYVPSVDFAQIHAALGNKDTAFQWLGRAVETRCSRVIHLNVDPDYRDLRSDPRFSPLVEKLGLTDRT